MGQRWWQVLPVGPTGYGDSPYQSPSTFAGNPLLISIDDCVAEGLVRPAALEQEVGDPHRVDYGEAYRCKLPLLAEAADHFTRRTSPELREELEAFREESSAWLEDYALFTALKRAHDLSPWTDWPPDLARRKPAALRRARRDLAEEILRVAIEQFLFARQWEQLRAVCRRVGVGLLGDLPIFVAHDSADVWANPELFHLDEGGNPTVVAGVPPDYFSATGQLWGNPLYRWERHESTGFEWWRRRLQHSFTRFDLVRIDHFRGFAGYWEVPGDAATAEKGRWVPAPGGKLFDTLLAEEGELPIVAEDLGVITEDVEELRDSYGFPGMKVLQFGFEEGSDHDPRRWPPGVVGYTGTHDNDTLMGWWNDPAHAADRRRARKLIGAGKDVNWKLIELALAAQAERVVVPLQDLLGLGSEARMNTPGTSGGNWRWRFRWSQVDETIEQRMRSLTEQSGRG